MNERIRELADRAGEYTDFESGLCTDEFLKKFAVLIAQESANYLENEYGKSVITGNDAADFIKRHFGVE